MSYYQTSFQRGPLMEDIPSSTLRKRRAQLLRQMPALDTLLRGSLIERYKRCGKPGCKCAEGPGHGPKYYLSVSFPGRRPQMDYVPQADYADVTQRLANYHRVREIIQVTPEDAHADVAAFICFPSV